jgi:hypothetical protein
VGDIAQGRVSAYILRFNALFQSVAYGMRYVPVSAGDYSIGKAMLSVGSHLFLVCDAFNAQRNRTQLVVVKVDVATGSIVKQVQVAGPANVTCSSVVLSRGLLTIACGVSEGLLLKPLIFTVDQDLSFKSLLAGYQRVVAEIVQPVPISFVASVVAVSQSSSMPIVTNGAFNSSAKLVKTSAAPTRLPSCIPSHAPTRTPTIVQPTGQPSSQPSMRPSRQPTSRPTAVPSVSPAPTAVPSTATPTSTHRPSGQPSSQPSAGPTGQPVSAPSGQPSAPPSGQPTGQPVGDPTGQPSRQPLSQPTGQPSVFPTSQPSAAPTCEPAADPTSQPSSVTEQDVSKANGGDKLDSFVVPVACSVFGLGLFVFVVYYGTRRNSGRKGTNKVSTFSAESGSLQNVQTPSDISLCVVQPEIERCFEQTNVHPDGRDVSSSAAARENNLGRKAPEEEVAVDSLHQFTSNGSSICSDFSFPSLGSSVNDEADKLIGKRFQEDADSIFSSSGNTNSDSDETSTSYNFSEDSIFD